MIRWMRLAGCLLPVVLVLAMGCGGAPEATADTKVRMVYYALPG